MHIRPKPWLAILLAAACLGSAHAQSTCVSDHDCQDGSWCNGVERCVGNPGRNMCMPAARPMCSAKKRCEETAHKCISPDKDKELHLCPKGEAYSTADEKCVATPQK
jgi:hypothetical protein